MEVVYDPQCLRRHGRRRSHGPREDQQEHVPRRCWQLAAANSLSRCASARRVLDPYCRDTQVLRHPCADDPVCSRYYNSKSEIRKFVTTFASDPPTSRGPRASRTRRVVRPFRGTMYARGPQSLTAVASVWVVGLCEAPTWNALPQPLPRHCRGRATKSQAS